MRQTCARTNIESGTPARPGADRFAYSDFRNNAYAYEGACPVDHTGIDGHTHEDSDSDRHIEIGANAYENCDTDADAHSYQHSSADGHACAHFNSDSAPAYTHRDSDPKLNSESGAACTHGDSDTHGHAVADSHADPNTDTIVRSVLLKAP